MLDNYLSSDVEVSTLERKCKQFHRIREGSLFTARGGAVPIRGYVLLVLMFLVIFYRNGKPIAAVIEWNFYSQMKYQY